MKKTKKVVAQHIPFWVECMFLVETLYNVVSHQMQQIEEGFEGFEGSQTLTSLLVKIC